MDPNDAFSSNKKLKRSAEAVGVNHAELSGQQLVGRIVKIWWPEEKMFHTGKIIVFNEERGLHMVLYDNAINETVDLDKERWQLVKEEDIVAGPSNAKAGGSNEFVDVHGYQVKANIVPTLQSIFTKYGDIARDCPFPCMRIGFLEAVCNVVEKLRSTESGFTSSQLGEMNRVISLAAMANLNVSWLQSFLGRINPVDEVATELRASVYRLVQAAGKDVDDWKRGLVEAEKRWEALVRQYAKMESDDVAAKQAFKRSVDELV